MEQLPRRAFIKRAVWSGVAGVGLALSLGTTQSAPARAQAPSGEAVFGAWERLPLEAWGTQFWTPASGALFVNDGSRALLRSDDGGATWRPVTLPPEANGATVDPTDHTVLYASAKRLLYRSTDDAATWQQVAPDVIGPLNRDVLPIVSAADPTVLYVVPEPVKPSYLLRSRDRGDSWERIVDTIPHTGDWGLRFVLPHPTDPARVFVGIGHGGVTPPPDEIRASEDQGQTWVKRSGPAADAWVGGVGANAGRFWAIHESLGSSNPNLRGLSAQHSRRWTSSHAMSNDDGVSWEVGPEIALSRNDLDRVRVELAADPVRAGRLFHYVDGSDGAGVEVSTDAGQTWMLAGAGSAGDVVTLTVGIDGQMLYAASPSGVWRLALS